MKKFLFVTAAMILFSSTTYAETIPNADTEMNQQREEMERQRIQRQIEEDMRRRDENISDEREKDSSTIENADKIKFELADITFDESEIITPEKFEEFKADYLNREVTLDDILKVVQEINDYYTKQGYITCRAYIKPQTLKGGVVHISLSEATTGEVTVSGNDSTRESYIKNRVKLPEGEIPNFHKVDKDITRFNSTNDVQLRIVMKAGKVEGTTDYEIIATEPQLSVVNISVDNNGQYSSGEWRESIFYTHNSLTGRRDTLSLGYTHSIGSDAFNASYEFPVSRLGTKVRLDYSTNGTHVKKGTWQNLMSSHSNYYAASITHPFAVSLTNRSSWSLTLSRQSSVNTLMDSYNFADNVTNQAELAFSQLNYGNGFIGYQKHSYTIGKGDNKVDDVTTNFGLYKFNGFARKYFSHGQSVYARVDAQIASTKELPSAAQYSIGGAYTVRGYREKILEGDEGFSFGLEYSVPLDKARKISAFCFFDGGKIISSAVDLQDRLLLGTGLGLQFNPTKNISSTITLGIPLRRKINGEEYSKTRIHFSLSGRF